MKKVLLASSALVASVATTAPAAAGEVTWNAFSHFFASSSDSDNVNSVSDFSTNSEIHLTFTDTADNGLTYGFKIELEADQDSTNNVDENYIFLSGDWGRVELGDNDGAADQLKVLGTPGFTYGMLNNSTGGVFQTGAIGGGLGARTASTLNDSGDDTKITYLTPSFSGFTAGLSYAASGNEGQTLTGRNGGATKRHHFEGGLQYSGEFDGISVKASGVANRFEGGAIAITPLEAAVLVNAGVINDAIARSVALGLYDEGYGIGSGLQIGADGLTFGISYSYNAIDFKDSSNDQDSNTFNAGVSYETGPWTFALGGVYSEAEIKLARSGKFEQELSAVSAGMKYNFAPGLATSLGGTFGEVDNTLSAGGGQRFSATNDFNSVVAGVQVSF